MTDYQNTREFPLDFFEEVTTPYGSVLQKIEEVELAHETNAQRAREAMADFLNGGF